MQQNYIVESFQDRNSSTKSVVIAHLDSIRYYAKTRKSKFPTVLKFGKAWEKWEDGFITEWSFPEGLGNAEKYV
jgi:hypothetical protein